MFPELTRSTLPVVKGDDGKPVFSLGFAGHNKAAIEHSLKFYSVRTIDITEVNWEGPVDE